MHRLFEEAGYQIHEEHVKLLSQQAKANEERVVKYQNGEFETLENCTEVGALKCIIYIQENWKLSSKVKEPLTNIKAKVVEDHSAHSFMFMLEGWQLN